MKNAPVQHTVEYFFFRHFQAYLLRRSHEEVRAAGARLGRLAYRLLGSSRKKAVRNLERVFPEKTTDERDRITRACFEHYGSQFCESISIGRFQPDEMLSLFDLQGWDIIERLMAEGRGFFLHTGHYGSFEMALYPCGILMPGYHGVVRPLDNPKINQVLMNIRGSSGAQILSKAGVGLKMRSAVRNGEQVAIVIDQHVRPSAGIRVPFLGHPAWTSSLLASLALKLKAPVVPFACLPIAGGRYRLEIREPIEGQTEGKTRDEAIADLTTRILSEVEHDIRQRPEWWLWMHRRWRD